MQHDFDLGGLDVWALAAGCWCLRRTSTLLQEFEVSDVRGFDLGGQIDGALVLASPCLAIKLQSSLL